MKRRTYLVHVTCPEDISSREVLHQALARGILARDASFSVTKVTAQSINNLITAFFPDGPTEVIDEA